MDTHQKNCLSMSTLDKMKYMAQDQLQSAMLVQDETCLGGLVMVLSNADGRIVKAALEVLQMLAQFSEHHQRLKHFLGLKYQLQTLITSCNGFIAELAGHIHNILWKHEGHTGSNNMSGRVDERGTNDGVSVPRKIKAKNVILQIRGMVSKECVEVCRNQLMKVKGVISITFDMKEKQCKLRVRAEVLVEKLLQAIAKTLTMKATQVIYNEYGEKIMKSLDDGGSEGDSINMPDYPKVESPVKGPADMASAAGLKPGGDGWNFIQNIGNFLSNSFYW